MHSSSRHMQDEAAEVLSLPRLFQQHELHLIIWHALHSSLLSNPVTMSVAGNAIETSFHCCRTVFAQGLCTVVLWARLIKLVQDDLCC